MKNYELKYMNKKLLKMKQEAENKLKDYKDFGFKDTIKHQIEELSVYDNHPADLGSESFERDKFFALKNHQVEMIADINEALDKINKGDYGICDFCGEEIGFERLDALPTAKLCIQCQKNRTIELEEVDYDRPIEEAVLLPPFGRTSTLETDNNAYDGEDALQDVLKYGSSSGPQDISVNHLVNYDNAFLGSDEDPGAVEKIEKLDEDDFQEQLPDK
jgi:YteA family regulatory protein